MRESRTSGTLPHFASTGNRYLRILAARCLRAGSVEPSLRPEQTSSGPFCGSRSPFSDDPGCARLDCGGGNDDSGKRYGDGGGHGWAMIVLEESNSRSGGRRFRALLTGGWADFFGSPNENPSP